MRLLHVFGSCCKENIMKIQINVKMTMTNDDDDDDER